MTMYKETTSQTIRRMRSEIIATLPDKADPISCSHTDWYLDRADNRRCMDCLEVVGHGQMTL